MKKYASLMLMLLAVMLVGQRFAQAGALGIAGDYNVFVFGDINQSGTDVQGRVAAGGNATFGSAGSATDGFSIASKITDPAFNLVVGGNVNLTNGSVGSSKLGDIWYGGSAVIASPGLGTEVSYGSLLNGNPIDFASAQSYLTALSGNWGGLTTNGTTSILNNGTANYEIDLTGIDANLNIFSLQAGDITQDIAFKFFAPETATILVNIAGANASLMKVGFSFNGNPAENLADPLHLLGYSADYPYSHILFNFPDATLIDINQIAIDGSILAPFAHIDFGVDSHIDGNLIASSLSGQGESHDLPFAGNVPEPATLLLLAGGLVGMGARRRRK